MSDLLDSALARILAAATADDLEAVRVEVLGRKGVLTQLSKDMGKLAPEERASRGKFINTAKQALEEAWELRKSEFESAALSKRLDAETRERLAPIIKRRAIAWAVAFAEVEEIDRINIYWAGLSAMRRAIAALAPAAEHLLIDGRKLRDVALPQERICSACI